MNSDYFSLSPFLNIFHSYHTLPVPFPDLCFVTHWG